MGNAFGFVTSKEVVVAPWFKKPDVELFDASGELLTIYLDVTLPSLHQEAVTSREQVYERRGRLKQSVSTERFIRSFAQREFLYSFYSY